jgi:hypothetical protein
MALQGMLGQAAGALSLLGFVPHIVEIVRGTTRPNRVTWWIWTLVGAMLCASYYATSARHIVWVPVSYVVGPLVPALLSLFYGEGGAGGFDRACLGASLASLPVWWLARSPLVALVTNMAIDLLGALPTIRAAYRSPPIREPALLDRILFLVADLLNLCALGSWSVATALYPLYLAVLAAVLVLLMLRPALARMAPRGLGSRGLGEATPQPAPEAGYRPSKASGGAG